MIRLDVVGLPAPQGNKTVMPNGAMVEGKTKAGRAKIRSWRAAVAEAATDWLDEQEKAAGERPAPLDGPISMHIDFRFPSVASDPHRQRHTTSPDVDKILRATFDPLTHARIIHDDSRVWKVTVSKRYAAGTETIGATIEIESDAFLEDSFRDASKTRAKAERAALKARAS